MAQYLLPIILRNTRAGGIGHIYGLEESDVVASVRRIVLHLPTATPDLHAWRHIALALGARPG